jgi:N-acetylneuraminic acid mutarotase
MLSGTLLAFFRPEAPANVSRRPLTFAQRVAYQRAIEEVYWRHRIWPKERSNPKPSLATVISQAQLEQKVADYLRKSQALEDYRPITAEQLQAESDRIAKHTKQPEVLRELFEALGNDPFLIAECLARPVLTERMTADLASSEKKSDARPAHLKGLRSVPIAIRPIDIGFTIPNTTPRPRPTPAPRPSVYPDIWRRTSTINAPVGRYFHTAVWTGSEMIIWGGVQAYYTVDTGGRYNPATDSWTATSIANAPSPRGLHTAVWTGTEMVVWGGGSVLLGGYLDTGGRYNPITDSWAPTTRANVPLARLYHTAVWTGDEMIVWGGRNGNQLNTGGRYNPTTGTWTAVSTTNAPSARETHTAVWTSSEMIIWGGYLFDGISHFLNTGGRYDPTTDTWITTTPTSAPTGRRYHTAIWVGNEMVVWGGQDSNLAQLNTGGRYSPISGTWIATSTINAPSARDSHTAVWTGSEMIVWGGHGYTGDVNTGARYNPGGDSWTASNIANAPSARAGHTAVWTGSEMIVWGGSAFLINTGGRYYPR